MKHVAAAEPAHGVARINSGVRSEGESAKIAELRGKPLKSWVLHELRPAARSLMSRCTTSDVAERVLGHVIPDVRGVYDHHDYAKEKRDALIGLATYINGIVNPQPDKVVTLKRHATR